MDDVDGMDDMDKSTGHRPLSVVCPVHQVHPSPPSPPALPSVSAPRHVLLYRPASSCRVGAKYRRAAREREADRPENRKRSFRRSQRRGLGAEDRPPPWWCGVDFAGVRLTLDAFTEADFALPEADFALCEETFFATGPGRL